jgi:plastocyanin
MKPISSTFLWLALLAIIAGCQSIPTSAKSGHVVDVPILSSEPVGDIAVNPGDEVRWVNKRTAPVQVVLIDPVSDKQVSCKNRFGGFMTRKDTAKVAPGDTASLCFTDSGTFRYVVRMESSRETGEINVPGAIRVGQQASETAGQPQ